MDDKSKNNLTPMSDSKGITLAKNFIDESEEEDNSSYGAHQDDSSNLISNNCM